MNEITGRQCPTLFDKGHGILYMPSHTKAFDYPVRDRGRGPVEGGVYYIVEYFHVI